MITILGMGAKNIAVSDSGKRMESNRWECAVCKEGFWKTSKFLDHMAATNHYILICNICNTGFCHQEDLDEHYLSNHNEVINVYKCKECHRKFSQKSQLEQHMQFHLATTSTKPAESKCNPTNNNLNDIRYNAVSDGDDDDDEYISFEEKVINKVKKTRSGRVVKAKRRFENEIPEAKNKHKKQSDEVSVSGDVELVSDKLSKVTLDIQPVACGNSSKKQLYVLAKKIPDSVIQKYMRNECINTSSVLHEEDKTEDTGNTEGDMQEINFSQVPNGEERNVNEAVQPVKTTKEKCIKNANSSPVKQLKQAQNSDNTKCDMHKMNLRQVLNSKDGKGNDAVESVQSIQQKCIKNTNISPVKQSKRIAAKANKLNIKKCRMISATTNEERLNIMEDLDKIKLPMKFAEDTQQVMQCDNTDSENINTLLYEKLPNELNKSISLSSVSNKETIHSNQRNSKHNPQYACKTVSELLKEQNTYDLPIQRPTVSSAATTAKPFMKSPEPRVTAKQFLYVGPAKQDFDEIKAAILEMKTQSKQNEDTRFLTAGKGSNVTLQNASPPKQTVSCSNSKTARQNPPSSTINFTHNIKDSTEINKRYPLHGDGILDKKIVKDYLIVQVTPELMQEMQKKALGDSSPKINSVNARNITMPSVLQNVCKIKDLDVLNKSETDKKVIKAKSPDRKTGLTTKQYIPPSLETLSNTYVDTSIGNFSFEDGRLTDKIPPSLNNSTEESDEVITKMSKRVLDRFKAKLEEKERKKKKKYLLKKRMRHLENCKNLNSHFTKSVQNSQVSDYNVTNTCSKFKEFDDKNVSGKDEYSTEFNIDDHINLYIDIANSFIRTNRMGITDTSSFQTNVESGRNNVANEKNIQKISELCLKFQKTLHEEEYLLYLNELDSLITPDISKKCSMVLPILRFCRLYVENYEVKQQALSILNKIS